MVVPFAAGGPVDVLGRILAQYLGEVIGKQVIIDNVPGGGGMSGSLRVSQARARWLQFVLGCIGTHALNQTLSKKPLYNAATDFAPVALIADVGLVLLTRKDLPASNLAGIHRLCQGKPGQDAVRLRRRRHLVAYRLRAAQPDDRHRHHRTFPIAAAGPRMADLIAGRIDYLCNIASTVGPGAGGKAGQRRSPH